MKSVLIIILAAVLPPLHAAPWFDGADLSALDRIEELGGTFRDANGHSTDALAALASTGANCVRLRLFVATDGRRRVGGIPFRPPPANFTTSRPTPASKPTSGPSAKTSSGDSPRYSNAIKTRDAVYLPASRTHDRLFPAYLYPHTFANHFHHTMLTHLRLLTAS